nr:hypothetical protein [Tanacetum cinerariifolium]
MTSFGYRLNPRFAIKECSSCGALYTINCSCSKGSVEDKILVPKLPENCARCAKCGHPVNGPYCQGCAILREKLKEDLITYLKYFQDTSESFDDSTNVVNTLREPFVVKQDHGVNPPHIDKCCCECGNALDGIFCQQCICKSYGKGAHTGYNFPPKVSIISNPEPCNQTRNNELPQTLPSFDTTCYSEKEKSVPCVSKPNFVDESSKIFNLPPQPPIYYCEFCGSNAQYGHYCIPQVPFICLDPGCSWNQQYKPEDLQELFREHSNDVQNIHEELAEYINTPGWNRPAFYDDDDDDDDVDYTIAITPVLSTEEPIDSLSMGDELLDTISATESDEIIKSSVEDLVLIPSESEGIPEHMCDVPFHDNSSPLDVLKDQFEDFSESNDEFSSTDNDSFSIDNIDYVEASPPNSELVSSKVIEIVISEETNTFHNSLPEFENFYFDLGEISSGSTTTNSDMSLLDYEAFSFNNDHIKEISSGSTTTHFDISLSEYDSFIFDFTHEEFVDELAHIISPPKICENLSTTRMNLPIEDDHSPLLAYVVWIFFAYLTYPVIPLYLHSFGNEDTIFDPGITINCVYSFKPGLSHRYGAFKKFNNHRSHLNEWPMIINGKNIPILDVLLFYFYPP